MTVQAAYKDKRTVERRVVFLPYHCSGRGGAAVNQTAAHSPLAPETLNSPLQVAVGLLPGFFTVSEAQSPVQTRQLAMAFNPHQLNFVTLPAPPCPPIGVPDRESAVLQGLQVPAAERTRLGAAPLGGDDVFGGRDLREVKVLCEGQRHQQAQRQQRRGQGPSHGSWWLVRPLAAP